MLLCRAVTSSGSAELIAVSSLFTYDGYMHYINPRATGGQLLVCSKIMILVYTVLMGKTLSVDQILTLQILEYTVFLGQALSSSDLCLHCSQG